MFSKNTETRGAAINAIPTDARRHECGGITSSSRSGARFLLQKIWIWRLHTAAPHTRISTHKSFAPYFVHISTLRLTFIAINFPFDHISKQRRTVARRNGACMLSWVCIDYISQKRERAVYWRAEELWCCRATPPPPRKRGGGEVYWIFTLGLAYDDDVEVNACVVNFGTQQKIGRQ